MDAASTPGVYEIVWVKSAQVGGTEAVNNIIGYHIQHDPSPMLIVQPTIDMAMAYSKDRIAPMIRDTPALLAKFGDATGRDSGNTLLHKSFPGGHVTMAGANAPASLASRPVRLVACDEVDRFPASAGTEGDPVSLADKRTTTFHNKLLLKVSTPTVKGFSRIDQAFKESDQRYYHVACVYCGHPHVLRWGNVVWPKGKPEAAVFTCPGCSKTYTDTQKNRMVRIAEDVGAGWVATAPFNGRAGFHISELYSPWVPLAKTVENFLLAKPYPERLQVWINTALGETWDQGGKSLNEHELLGRVERYAAEVPARALFLTCGADTHPDRIECEVVGWGAGEESWSIDYAVFHGDPDIREGLAGSPWTMLTDYIRKSWRHESGVDLTVSTTFIDTGGSNTQAVYEYVKSQRGRRVFGVKGFSGENLPIVGSPNRKRTGREARKIDLYPVGVDQAKGSVTASLAINEPGPRYCHFPEGRDLDYFQMLTSERMITRYVKGFPKREWQKIDGRKNEGLDCRVYAYAAFVWSPPQFDKLAYRIKQMRPSSVTPVERERDTSKESSVPSSGPQGEADAIDYVEVPMDNPRANPKPKRPTRRGGYINQWRL